ncbi:MAG TPA: response regulator transcription factor [Steroidobacteraceae bacterium]|nr:response regulator transcription factor [Steroidobacteraceae bacterium]
MDLRLSSKAQRIADDRHGRETHGQCSNQRAQQPAEDHLIEAAVRAGAEGYVLKTDSRDDLFDAVRSVAAGKRFTSPSVRGYLIRGSVLERDAPRAPAPRAIELTQREREVISLIAAGRRTREIAQALSLSHKTIEKHRATLMRKLGLRNASAVAAYAIAHGLADS